MRDCVTVAAAARLHLGFLDLNGGLGRKFGSLGLAIEEPDTLVEIARAPTDSIEGPQAERAARDLKRLTDHLGLPGGHRLTVHRAIPAHAGLGSGTQMALAVAAALRRLHGLAADVEADALLLDRGNRSGLGASFFQEGGVALDGGRGEADRLAPIIARLPFPKEWRVLLILDPSRDGIHGEDELAAFRALPPFPAEIAAHLCRVALMQALPAIVEHDIVGFGSAVTEIQANVGDYFQAAQGGRYASPGVAAVLERLAGHGVRGYGQSSWGPTGFAFAQSASHAEALRDLAAPLAQAAALELRIVKGRNYGAGIVERARGAEKGVRHG
jgi:beta-RFAP synthase